MAYNVILEERINNAFQQKSISFEVKKMMGGLCYLVDGKMCAGIVDDKLMARINPDIYLETLTRAGCVEMDFTKKPMKGFVFVLPEAMKSEVELAEWLQLCLDYNPIANKSKKKEKNK